MTNIVAISQIIKNNPKKNIALVSPQSSIGGHFSSLRINNLIFDPGSIFYEFTSFNNSDSDDIYKYNPYIRNDAGRYYKLVEIH